MEQQMLQHILETVTFLKENMLTRAEGLTKEDAKLFLTKEDAKLFLTKEDAKHFLTKEDAKQFATKDDLKAFATKDDLKAFATKEDIAKIYDVMATKNDIAKIYDVMATKNDIARLDNKIDHVHDSLHKKIEDVKDEFLGHVDDFIGMHKRNVVEQAALKARQDRIRAYIKTQGVEV